MQRFFARSDAIDEKNGLIRLTGPDVNHIRNVLRMKKGEDLWISDGDKKEYHCTIGNLEEEEIVLHILYAQEPDYELPCRIVLFQGLPKGEMMELIIQKAVELGAAAIVPVRTKRSVVQLDDRRAEKKTLRWQQIAEAAAKQCRRMKVPTVQNPAGFAAALKEAERLDRVLIPYELETGSKGTREVLRDIKAGESIGIFIGPEGGFEPSEVESAIQAGAVPVTLGHRILRTETASLALLSVLMFKMEELI